jgi:hypothetical protein
MLIIFQNPKYSIPCNGLITHARSSTDYLKDQETEVKWSVSRLPYAPKEATGVKQKYILLLTILLTFLSVSLSCFLLLI